ncbi:FmdB family zinc ribbon protein [Thiohalorhabdus sp.]|uniref:FmdB family zinc ribbon protein n=1 Tax=Thiohalorhabdus sp. TaxID=3094134 RepID=UPI002FC396E0
MPTYEYACASCGHQLEVKQRMTDDPLHECPECHEASLRKQLNSSGSFVLKGGGWYKDGYSSAKERESASSCGTGSCPAADS